MAGGLGAVSEGGMELLALETTVLGREELKEKDCVAGAGVSTAENLGTKSRQIYWVYFLEIKQMK